ncbi:MAG: hypothetical protein JXA91_08340 [Candidatus Thermoplasmatota archaeon]|nr:hypothetical protein [Candidatus Thermoplasmatota archaeon]
MLWTYSIPVFNENEKTCTPYYLVKNKGNNADVTDQSDLIDYEKGTMI